MNKFRKKPVVIEAIQLTEMNILQCYELAHNTKVVLKTGMDEIKWEDYCEIVCQHGLDIPTLEGTMKASMGDWIIKGVKGEVYPCKPDIFEVTYEAVEDVPAQPEKEGE